MDKLENKYRVAITEVNMETGEERIVDVNEYAGFVMLADHLPEEGKPEGFAEVIIHDNIMGIATKIAQSKKTSTAAKMATIMMDEIGGLGKNSGGFKNALLKSILGDAAGLLGGEDDDDDDD